MKPAALPLLCSLRRGACRVCAAVAMATLLAACPSKDDDEDCLDDDCTSPAPGGGAGMTGGSTTGGGGTTGTATGTSQAAQLIGSWIYSGASYPRADGTMAETVLAGNLTIRSNGTWEHERRIGGVTAFGDGRYTVVGKRLTLKHDDGSEDLQYDFFVGTHVDKAGTTFKALTLSFVDSSGWRYLLVEDK